MPKKREDFFWPSYTDLMTTLFFIMLVLYVLTFALLKKQQRATEEQLRKIREIQSAARQLPEKYFQYDPEYKRFTLKKAIHFEVLQSEIKDPADKVYLEGVGQSILGLIENLKAKDDTKGTSYMVILEGMASRDEYARNYQLSYERALALFNLWKTQGLNFDPSVCEVQIAGSGTGGVGRSGQESLNQRFLIQIIPKLGEIK